jgi:hypothetical protein
MTIVRINTSMPALEQILGLRTVNCLTRMAHPARLRLLQCERRAQPPRREGRRLPTTLRDERCSASRVPRGPARRGQVRVPARDGQAAILKAEQNHSMGRTGSATLSERDQPTLRHVLRHARSPAERRWVATTLPDLQAEACIFPVQCVGLGGSESADRKEHSHEEGACRCPGRRRYGDRRTGCGC